MTVLYTLYEYSVKEFALKHNWKKLHSFTGMRSWYSLKESMSSRAYVCHV